MYLVPRSRAIIPLGDRSGGHIDHALAEVNAALRFTWPARMLYFAGRRDPGEPSSSSPFGETSESAAPEGNAPGPRARRAHSGSSSVSVSTAAATSVASARSSPALACGGGICLRVTSASPVDDAS